MKLTHTKLGKFKQPGKYVLAVALLAALLAPAPSARAGGSHTATFPGSSDTFTSAPLSISAGGNTLTFTAASGSSFYLHNALNDTAFAPGTQLLETVDQGSDPNNPAFTPDGPLTITFSKPVDSFSFGVQDYALDHEAFQYALFNGTTEVGIFSASADNSSPRGFAPILGAYAPSGITSIQISSLSSVSGFSNDFYVGPITFTNAPVPEASTVFSFGLMLGLGGLALAVRRRTRRAGGAS